MKNLKDTIAITEFSEKSLKILKHRFLSDPTILENSFLAVVRCWFKLSFFMSHEYDSSS